MKRRSPAVTILVLILAIFTFTNCKTTAPEKPETAEVTMNQQTVSELTGSEWNIKSIDGQDVVVSDTPPSIAFLDEGSLGGNASCNRMMGSYEHGEVQGEISIALGGTTMMMCPEELMLQERSIQELLPKVTSYTVADDTLTLTTDDGKTIVASRADQQAAAEATSELVGPEWMIEDIDGKGVIDDSPASIEFMADGKLAGNASCNRMMGSFEKGEAEGEVSLEVAGTTRMMCPEALMNQENSLLEMLPKVTSYTIDDTATLHLKTDDGKTITARRR